MRESNKKTSTETAQIRKIKYILIISMAIFMLNFVSSQASTLGTFKQNDCVNLVQSCSACTYSKITSVLYPNSSVALGAVDMSTTDNIYYNYSFCNTSQLGQYIVNGYGDVDSIDTNWVYDFQITYTGDKITNEQAYIYIAALIFLVLLLLGVFYVISRLPSKDARDEEGTIVEVSMLKHLREVLWIFIWGIAMTIMFIVSNLGLAYLNNAMIGKFFFVIYQIMFYVLIIGAPLYFIWIFYKVFKDKEMKRLMERGIEFGGKGL